MIRRLLVTDDSTATAILRLVLGLVFFAHGAQKMLGWFGGYWVLRHDGFLHGPYAYPGSARLLSDRGGVFRWAGADPGTPQPE